MSIVAGCIGGDKRIELEQVVGDIYKYDRFDSYSDVKEQHACCFLEITNESIGEVMPYVSADKQYLINGDVIIDNRKELLVKLDLEESVSDSTIALRAYIKWDIKFVDHLIGEYALVIHDYVKDRTVILRDHVGRKPFYYSLDEGRLFYSTLTKPIREYLDNKVTVSDEYVADFLTIPAVSHEVVQGKCIYNEILVLIPGHYGIFENQKLTVHNYWEPLKMKPIKFKTDDEYLEAFNKLFDEAVECRLRSKGNVGIMLSSGLDSTAVAAVASDKLETLYAYTSYVEETPNKDKKNGFINDERGLIKPLVDNQKSIKWKATNYNNRYVNDDLEDNLEALEQPYKFFINTQWLTEIYKESLADNCLVMLDGQFGNSTISFGTYIDYLDDLFYGLKWVTLIKESHTYAKRLGGSSKRFVKYLIKRWLGQRFNKNGIIDLGKFTLASPELVMSTKSIARLNNIGYNGEKRVDLKGYRSVFFDTAVFNHIGSNTYKSLHKYGMISRDATSDKRIIEFCFRIPYKQFCLNGIDRALVRRSMEGRLPDTIRLNERIKGIQGANWIQRLKPHWNDIISDIETGLEESNISHYINIKKVKALIKNNYILVDGGYVAAEVQQLVTLTTFMTWLKEHEEVN